MVWNLDRFFVKNVVYMGIHSGEAYRLGHDCQCLFGLSDPVFHGVDVGSVWHRKTHGQS